MTKNKRIATIMITAILGVGLAVGSVISTKAIGKSFNAIAQNDVDWGHYTALRPTTQNPGSREFWVSCSDHTHQFTAPTEYRNIIERGAPTLAMVQEWGNQDTRYLASFDPVFDYMSNDAIAWGENDGTHVLGTHSSNDFGVTAAKVNELMAAGYTKIALDWKVDYASWADKHSDDKLVFFQTGYIVKMLSAETNGTVEFTLAADTPLIMWLQRDADNNAIKNKEFVISARLFNPTTLDNKMYTDGAWTTAGGSLAYNWSSANIVATGTWSLYFATAYATELYNAGYRTMTAKFTVTGTTTDYLTTEVNGVVTSYKNAQSVYELSFLLLDLKAVQLTVRTNNQDVTDGNHNDGCTGNNITISNITLSEEEDTAILKVQARRRLSRMFYAESNCWNYFRHNGWGANSWGPDCTQAVFGTETNGQPYFTIQNTFFQDMKLAGYTKVSFRVQGVSVTEGKTIGALALYTQGTGHNWNEVYFEPQESDHVFNLNLATVLETLDTAFYLAVDTREAGSASATASIITLSNVMFSVGEDDIDDASIKEFYTTKQVRRVEQQDEWKDPIGTAENESGHKEFYKFGRYDVIHLSAHYASDDPKYDYNKKWSEWRFQHQKAGLTSVTFTYLYEDSNTELGNDGVSDVHTMCQWYGAAYQGRTMTLVADGEWHTITVTGEAYDINFFVMKIYHFTGDIYISNIIYA